MTDKLSRKEQNKYDAIIERHDSEQLRKDLIDFGMSVILANMYKIQHKEQMEKIYHTAKIRSYLK